MAASIRSVSAWRAREPTTREQSLAAREVPVGRARRDADPPGRLAEDDAVGAVAGGELGRRIDQGVPEVAVVVGPGGRRRGHRGTDVDIVHISL